MGTKCGVCIRRGIMSDISERTKGELDLSLRRDSNSKTETPHNRFHVVKPAKLQSSAFVDLIH